MRRWILPIVLVPLLAVALRGPTARVSAQPPPAADGLRPSWCAPPDSFVSERDSLMNLVLEDIAGRESEPAESVFKNLKVLKRIPAGRLVRVMNFGFGHSLGVPCSHCHIENHWADEDKKTKQVARDMMAMTRRINEELLAKIPNLRSEHPAVNCSTCHRGERKPALHMGGPEGPGERRPDRGQGPGGGRDR